MRSDFTHNRIISACCHLLVIGLLLMSGACSGGASMEVRQQTVVGHELRLIVETSHDEQTIWSHMATTTDVSGYLVVVDLSSRLPMARRSRVYGPLWHAARPRSATSFEAR